MAEQARTRTRAPRGEGERLKEEILDVAERLLIERGTPDAIPMREIASRVGVTPPAIYLHFADKGDLFFECCARRFTEMSAFMEEAAGRAATARDKLEALGRAYIEFGLDRGEQYRVILGGSLPESPVDLGVEDPPGVEALMLTAATVAEGMASGEFRTDLDPMSTAFALWSAVHGAVLVILNARGNLELPEIDEAKVVDHLITTVMVGVCLR